MKSIACINQKGGVGKTTTTINVGAGLARKKKKILLIDLDPQASLTHSLGIAPQDLKGSMYNVLKQEMLLDEILITKGKLSVAPASIALASLEDELRSEPHKKYLLQSILATAKNYDYILIDCPPSLGMITINVLAAVDEVIIPVQTEFLALQGLSQLLDTIKVIKKRINPSLTLAGIICTRVNKRKMHHEVIEYLREQFKKYTFKTVIPENIALAEAQSYGEDIDSHDPHCKGAQAYKALCRELIKRESRI